MTSHLHISQQVTAGDSLIGQQENLFIPRVFQERRPIQLAEFKIGSVLNWENPGYGDIAQGVLKHKLIQNAEFKIHTVFDWESPRYGDIADFAII